MDELSILYLAPRVPWPLDTGGKIRSYHLLRALALRHRLHLLTFDGPEAAGGLAQMRGLGVTCDLQRPDRLPGTLIKGALGLLGPLPLKVLKYQSPALLRRLRRAIPREGRAVVHCDHIHMAPYGPLCGLPFVIDEHNVETLIWERFAADRAEPLYRRLVFRQQALLLRQLEGRLAARAALVLACSEADQQQLRALPGGAAAESRLVPNGVDVAAFSAPGPAELSGHVFFTGSMDWAPNENAVLTFLDEIWPAMRAELADLRFVVVGRDPGQRLQARHGADGVTVTGTVPDVRPYMRGALALLVPMRVGGGTRLKILEAFAGRVPVVSTAVGIEGIEAEPGTHYLRAETAAEFCAQTARLRSDPALGRRLAEAGLQLASGRYSWEAIGGALAEEYGRRFG
jgi:glycosyltransferase involved in cell wall biosynthesis